MIISESLNVGELCLHQQSTLTFLQVFLAFLKYLYLASRLSCSKEKNLPFMKCNAFFYILPKRNITFRVIFAL